MLDANTFYQVMGKSYDLWTDPDRAAYEAFWERCIGQLRKSNDVAISSLVDKALRKRELAYFLAPGAPSPERPNARQHYGFLSKYARVVTLRNARLYANLQLEEAKGLPDSRENLERLVAEISEMQAGEGVFIALPDNEKQAQVASLTALKEEMSAALVDAAFSEFDIAAYPENLDGLKLAWADRGAMEADAAIYATTAQVSGLRQKFDTTFAPLSKAVVAQFISSMPTIEASVTGFLEGKKQKGHLERDVVPYLSAADQARVIAPYEQRNVDAVNQFLPGFRQWLTENISPDRAGKETLQELSIAMLDSSPGDLEDKPLTAPYSGLAFAILDRHDRLRFEICDLPPGFEELRGIICLEAAATQN